MKFRVSSFEFRVLTAVGLLGFTVAAIVLMTATAQNKPAPTASPKNDATIVAPQQPGIAPGTVAEPSPLIAPAMRSDDLLKIRNLQYEQDKKLIALERAKLRVKELEDEIAADTQLVNAAVRAGGNAVNVDFTKFIFDLDLLKFVLRPQIQGPGAGSQGPANANPSPTPKEKKP